MMTMIVQHKQASKHKQIIVSFFSLSLSLSLSLSHKLKNHMLIVELKVVFILLIVVVNNYDMCLSYRLNSTTTTCPWYTCSSDASFTIRYPFYEINYTSLPLDEDDYYCGYRQFGLSCSPTNQTMFSLGDELYVVKDINYTDSTLTLVDADVDVLLPSDLTCHRARHNTTVSDSLPLQFSSSNFNLTFFFNCTDHPSNVISLHDIPCLANDEYRKSYVGLTEDVSDSFNYWSKVCQDKVEVTVMEDKINVSDLVGGFGAAMKQGFMLNWRAQESCSSCEENGGYCGLSYTKNDSLCYCKKGNGNTSSTYCKRRGLNITLKLVIGFGAAGGSITMMLILFFIYQRCTRKKYVASNPYLSQTISYDSSSVTDIEKMGNYFGLHIFTYAELEEATNNFDSDKEVGDGGFGTVYYGKLRDGRVVAIKRLYENNCKRVEQFMNEVEILTRLRHKNLVSLYGCTSRHSHELLLVYEYIPNGTIADHLHGEGATSSLLSWPIRLKIAIETADALAYLHACEIIHRDVKTNNILLDNNFCVKVADFGLSRLFPTDVTHVSTAPQGTPGYLDPDYHHCYQLTHKSDVYSFGVVLIELISSKPAVDITRHRHEINLSSMAVNKIQSGALHELIDPSFGFESDCKVRKMMTEVAELAVMCLRNDKDMRPSMKDVWNSLIKIQSQGDNVVKLREGQILADEAALLKNDPIPFSPDSVTVNWVSGSSLKPNVSG